MRRMMVALLLVSATAVADDRVFGHMGPFPDELLSSPVRLKCGLVIREWRPARADAATVARLEHVCGRAMAAFLPFLAAHGLKAPRTDPFFFDASLLPYGSCYRCLNDVEYRFSSRPMRGEVWGYTSFNLREMYMIGDPDLPRFEETLTHELYHAAEIHYGVYQAHHPTDAAERTAISEAYAGAFTRLVNR